MPRDQSLGRFCYSSGRPIGFRYGFYRTELQLRFHRETRERPIYGLVPSKNVGKLRPSERAGADKDHYEPGLATAEALSLPQLAGVLSRLTGHRVVDNTGMAGLFQIRLQFTKDTLFTALEEQLGLRLEPLSTELLEVLVIDQAQQPSEN